MSKKFHALKVALFLVLVATLLTGCFGIFGGDDQWTVSGVVMDEDDNPIIDATILLEYSTTATTETDEEGKWTASVSGDSVTISVEKLGYEFDRKEVTVKKDDDEKSIDFTGTALSNPLFDPAAGEFIESVEVKIVMVGNYTIYYTLDGSEPTADSIKYTEPFELTETTTVKAIAIDNDDADNTSDVVEATYVITELEFVKNPGFEDGLAHWEGQGAEISIDEEEFASGSKSLFVTNRADIAHGPKQVIDGFEFDTTYQISFKVLYKDGPDTRVFNMSHQNGDWQTIFNMVSGTATKGEWTTITGTYQFPEVDKADPPRPTELDGQWIFIETSWVGDPTPENDWMDFWVDDFSITIADPVEEE